MTTPENSLLLAIQTTLARQDEALLSIKESQQEIKADQKDVKAGQKEMQESYGTLALLVNTLQGQVNGLQSQTVAVQTQVNSLLSWQLAQTQLQGVQTAATNDRIYDVQTLGFTRTIAQQAWPLGIVGGGILTAITNHFLHFLP